MSGTATWGSDDAAAPDGAPTTHDRAVLEGRLLRIDPTRNEVTAEAGVGPGARRVAVGAGAVWVTSRTGVLTRVRTP